MPAYMQLLEGHAHTEAVGRLTSTPHVCQRLGLVMCQHMSPANACCTMYLARLTWQQYRVVASRINSLVPDAYKYKHGGVQPSTTKMYHAMEQGKLRLSLADLECWYVDGSSS